MKRQVISDVLRGDSDMKRQVISDVLRGTVT